MEGVRGDVVVRGDGAGRDRDVGHRGDRGRHGDVLLGNHAVSLEAPEAGLPVERAVFQKVFDQVGPGAVEGDDDDLRRSVLRSLVVVVIVGPDRWRDGSDGEDDGKGERTRAQIHGLSDSAREQV
jgi:hypothetical protein